MSPCDNLISFVDGQLDAGDAEVFREHLRTCETCPDNLIEAAQLSAQLSTLPLSTPSTRVPAPSPPPAELPSTADGREPPGSIARDPSSDGTAAPVSPTRGAVKDRTARTAQGKTIDGDTIRTRPPIMHWKRAVGWG